MYATAKISPLICTNLQYLAVILFFMWSTVPWSAPVAQGDEIFASLPSACVCVYLWYVCIHASLAALLLWAEILSRVQRGWVRIKSASRENWQAPTAELSGCQLWHHCQSAHITRAKNGPLHAGQQGPTNLTRQWFKGGAVSQGSASEFVNQWQKCGMSTSEFQRCIKSPIHFFCIACSCICMNECEKRLHWWCCIYFPL